MKRIGVLTGGGDSPGMNAAIRAVVRRGIFKEVEVIGIKNGFEGLLNGDFVPMDLGSVHDIIHRGGTILKSSHSNVFLTPEGQLNAIEVLKKSGIDALIVIGGKGSLKGAARLADHGFPTIGIPASINNDIPGTDYAIGYDTAVNTALEAIDRLRDTADSHERTTVVEVMGKQKGFIALLTGLCSGAESIIIPETPQAIDGIIDRLQQGHQRGKTHSIIVVAEGISGAEEVGRMITDKLGIEVRVSILGHIQRGGVPTATDRMVGSQMGAYAVDLLLNGQNGVLIGKKRDQIIHTEFGKAANDQHAIDPSLYDLAMSLSI